jgi:hypothetical protein
MFLIIPAYFLSFFTDSREIAIGYVGFCIGPILRIAIIFIIFNIAEKLLKRKDDAFLAAAILAANPISAQFCLFGRPDHHSFITLFMVLFLRCIIFFIESQFTSGYALLAAITAMGIWISPESLIPLLLTDATLFLYALSKIDSHIMMAMYLKNILIACFIGTIILSSTTIGFGIFFGSLSLLLLSHYICLRRDALYYLWILALPIYLAMQFVAPVFYDEISVVHFSLYLCSAFVFGAISYCRDRFKIRRPFLFIIFAFCIAALFLYSYPKFLYGMEADIDPYIKKIWLCKVLEMKSPFELGYHFFFITHVAVQTIAILSKVLELIDKKSSAMRIMRSLYNGVFFAKTGKTAAQDRNVLPVHEDLSSGSDEVDCEKNPLCNGFIIWIILIVLSVCYMILSSFAYRMLPYSFLFGLILVVDFGMSSRWTKKLHRFVRIVLTFFMVTLFMFLTAYSENEDENNDCDKHGSQLELLKEIDKLSEIPVVIMAHSNDGPQLLYYTKHSVVGAPYHRQAEGIINSFKVMEDKFSESEVKRILILTDASYILIRKPKKSANASPTNDQSLPKLIIDGKQPSWISIDNRFTEKFDDIIVARIDKNMIREKK